MSGFASRSPVGDQRLPQNASIANERHLLEAIFQSSPAAMALWRGPEMVFELVNPGYQELFPGRALLGKPFLEALPEFQGQPFMALFRQVLETGEPFVGHEVLARHGSGADSSLEDHYYDFSYVRLDDASGQPYGVYDHAIDVTERVLARRALEESRTQLQATVAALQEERGQRDRFIAMLSHDLRTPLMAARMSAQLLARKAGDTVALQRIAGRIAHNMDRADQLLRDMLDLHRLQAGEQLPIERTECELHQLAAETLEELGSVHGDRFVLRASGPVRGFWACSSVRRILENLCTNAVKYGARNRPVTVSLSPEGPAVRLVVHNEGTPVPPEDQAVLFEPFRRTPAALATGQKGWGLGLALVRGLAEAHGGNVTVFSAPGLGTTFTVTLPVVAHEREAPRSEGP